MDPKKTVIREAEEIIANFVHKQQEFSGIFYKQKKEKQNHKKSKRHNLKGIGLLLSLGISILLWGLLFRLIF